MKTQNYDLIIMRCRMKKKKNQKNKKTRLGQLSDGKFKLSCLFFGGAHQRIKWRKIPIRISNGPKKLNWFYENYNGLNKMRFFFHFYSLLSSPLSLSVVCQFSNFCVIGIFIYSSIYGLQFRLFIRWLFAVGSFFSLCVRQ